MAIKVNKPQFSAITQGFEALKTGAYDHALNHFVQAWQQHHELRACLEFNIAFTADKAGTTPPRLTPYPLQHDLDGERQARQQYQLTLHDTDIDIVVPVYNALDEVKACLACVVKYSDRHSLHLIIVNDGSDQATSQYLQTFSQQPQPTGIRVSLLENTSNRGYTPTVNRGLSHGKGDFVVTLNSDTRVTAGWLNGLLRCIRSSPDIGICGPLSNAASWQNVPNLTEQGAFAVNLLPEGMQADDMAVLVRQSSVHSYPKVPFINGFCMMLKRRVLSSVGLLDEARFPTGYGEENDLCLRARQAGFTLAIADDTYVYHSKSKSFGHTARKELSQKGSAALKAKHTPAVIENDVSTIKSLPELQNIRQRVQQALKSHQKTQLQPQRIVFCMPLAGGGGGVHSIVQECIGLRKLGINAQVGVPARFLAGFLTNYADIAEREAIFLPVPYQGWSEVATQCDVLIATIFSSVPIVANAARINPELKTAYYIQDYEPYFITLDDAKRSAAKASYSKLQQGILFAKTHWIADKVYQAHGKQVFKVSPSIDHRIYYPADAKPAQLNKPVVISAMLRPKTPRRGAERTLRVLANMLLSSQQPVRIITFGCDAEAPQLKPYLNDQISSLNLKHWRHQGVLTRPQVADVLRRSDVFIDLSDYQAFGRTGLEAMACGCALVTTEFGGVYEYVQTGTQQNAIVVNPYNEEACFKALDSLCADLQKLTALQRKGPVTAQQFSIERASQSLLALFS